MINNIFPLPVQTPIQAVAESVTSVPFQSSALWIDDEMTLWLVYGY